MDVAPDVEQVFDVEQLKDVEQPKDAEQAQRGGTGPKRWNRPTDQPPLLSGAPRFARTAVLASLGSPLRGATFKKRGNA